MNYFELKVKFVVHEGEVLALFPTEKFNNDNIMCYARIGQHGEASKSLLKCKKAKPNQYYSLLVELRGIYENSYFADAVIILKVV